MSLEGRTRWIALLVLCFGDLMIVLDATIVNVALPSIRTDLGFSQTSLAWVVNAYLITFGGFLLLGGRLGDLFGHRRLFLIGLSIFTLASLACGLSTS
jgi:MFS family permease